MNHGLKIMEDGTLVVTLPKDKAVKRVLVDYSGTQNGTLMYPDENAMAYDEFLKTMDMAIEATTENDAYSIGMRNGIRYAKSVVDNVDPEYESVNEEKKDCSSTLPEPKGIGYVYCSSALLKMWMDNVLTDGEYNRIMEKLNAMKGKENE